MGAVAMTGVGHLAFSAADASSLFIPLAAIGWGSYTYYRIRTDGGYLERTGFRGDGLDRAFLDATLIAAGSMALMAGIGAAQGSLMLRRDGTSSRRALIVAR